MDSKKELSMKMLWVMVGVGLTVIGFIVIPPLLKKYTNKMYKASLRRNRVDFDDMGPEIVNEAKGED